jgi:hypothetical protein
LLLAILLIAGPVRARDPLERPPTAQSADDTQNPAYTSANHDVGRLFMSINNYGTFGPAEYPKDSYKTYLSRGGLWVGAVIEGDTLVSTSVSGRSREFQPAPEPEGLMRYRSTIDPNRPWYEGAISHQDYVAVFTDTCTGCPNMSYDEIDFNDHIPLNIEVTRTSYAWAFDYSQDFILMDYSIKNIGDKRLRYVYIGFYVDGDVATSLPLSGEQGPNDDQVGFLKYYPSIYLDEHCPPDSDLINMGWTADGDGNMWRQQDYARVFDVTGLRIISAPQDSLAVSFNWWAQGGRRDWYHDFGPQRRESYRTLAYDLFGTPSGDRARYHFMRNREVDYDQYLQYGKPSYDAEWVQPPVELRDSLFESMDPCYLLSFGPFGLEPGQSLPFTVAYVAGMAFHRDAHIAEYLPDFPETWYENVYFDELARNAMWAEWIYDNPGIDTDSDGYAGEYTICDLGGDSVFTCDTLVDTSANPDTNYTVCYWDFSATDTVWRTGDGVPDLRAAYPPPNPSTFWLNQQDGDSIRALRVYPEVGKIRMIWNGAATETAIDPFSHKADFEGYNVYLALDDRPTSFSIITSYDRANYVLWAWDYTEMKFRVPSPPYTLEQLRCLFADSCGDADWQPLDYTRSAPLIIDGGPKGKDGVYYFEPMGNNRSNLANDPATANTDIRKVYPDAPKPPFTDPDSIAAFYPDRDDPTYFTPDGYLKYYEYEYTFDGLLATVPYYVNVTAFDYGYPELSLPGLQGDPAFQPKAVYALPSSEVIAEQHLEVFVYPNPYRIDADYRDRGYEGNQRWHLPEDKTRLIHFANLPPKCTISILSLDGDLIRELKHDVDPTDYLANHETWDLISKNSQLVVTGLYYWTVEDDEGHTQIGKLVIVM